jgi:hypothetical protein
MKGDQLIYKLERISAPVGADAFVNTNGLINVAGNEESPAGSFSLNISRTTVPGTYVFKYTLGVKEKTVTLVVEDTVAEVKLKALKNGATGIDLGTFVDTSSGVKKIFATEANRDSDPNDGLASTATFNFVYKQAGVNGFIGVAPNADGSFDVVRDYLPIAGAHKEFYFKLDGSNFTVPQNIKDQAGIAPNIVQLSLLAPDGLNVMRTKDTTQIALPTLSEPFRIGFDLPAVRQIVDSGTPVGKYTYTLRVLQNGVEIMREEVVVNVKDFTEKTTFTAYLGDAGDMFTAIKTAFENELVIPAIGATGAYIVSGDVVLPADTAAVIVADLKAGFVARSGFAAIQPFNFTTYTAARTKFINDFLTALPFMNGAAYSTSLVVADKNGELKGKFLQYFAPPAAGTITITGTGGSQAITPTTGVGTLRSTIYTNVASEIAIYTGLASAMINKLAANPTISDIATSNVGFNTAKAAYETKVADLFPTYVEFLAAVGRAATDKVAPNAAGVFEIAKPFKDGLDVKTVTFDLLVENYESLSAPGASIANSWIDDGVKKELLPLVKTVTGPGLIPNAAFNTANTKLAIVLNEAGLTAETVGTVSTEEFVASKYTSYLAAAFGSAPTLANKVTLKNIIALDVGFLTPNGEYTFNVNLGKFTETIVVKVVDPTPKINFTLTPKANASNSNWTYVAADDKYYFNLGVSPASVAADRALFRLRLSTENMSATDGELPYTITYTTPTATVTNTNTVAVSAVAGNDGKLALTTPESGIPNTDVSDDADLDIREKGTYIYDLTLGGVRKVLTLVVNEYPELKDVVVKVGTTNAVVFNNDFMLVNTVKKFTVNGTSVNLPAGTLYYSLALSDSVANTASGTFTGISLVTGTTRFEETDSGLAGSPTVRLVPLDLAAGIPVQLISETGAPGLLSANTSILNRKKFLQITFYSRANATSFDSLAPTYDLKKVGHETVPFWFGAVAQPIVTSGTIANNGTTSTSQTLVVKSNVPGDIYYVSQVSTEADITLLSTILVGTKVAYTSTSNANQSITLPAVTANTIQEVFYVIVYADNTISEIVKVTEAA